MWLTKSEMPFDEWKMQYRHRVALMAGIKVFEETIHMIPHDDILIEQWRAGDAPDDCADEEMEGWEE